MMAGIAAASKGADVIILEHNEKAGKKIYITGKGRCNVTNACTVEELISHTYRGSKFLYSAFYNFGNDSLMEFFEKNGCPLKIERGNRVFPITDHASDITKTLLKVIDDLNVKILYNTKAVGIKTSDNKIMGVCTEKNNGYIKCDAVILATGGISYPATGSDGSGYKLAKELGHTVTKLSPGLTGLITDDPSHKTLEGLSLKNISISIIKKQQLLSDDIVYNNNSNCTGVNSPETNISDIKNMEKKKSSGKGKNKQKQLFNDTGELLFTANGISGPIVLRASSHISPEYYKEGVMCRMDLKPALDEKTLDKRLLRDFEQNTNKKFGNVLKGLYPARLTPVMIKYAGVDPDIQINNVTVSMREAIIRATKNWCFNITGCGNFNQAIITRGGVSLKEINPSTMESRLINGLYFSGEIMDLDAATGGFNLQIAWSTGYLAGESAAEKGD